MMALARIKTNANKERSQNATSRKLKGKAAAYMLYVAGTLEP
jgi:hypothetical protein